MNINDLKDFMKKCKFEINGEVTENATLGELGMESLDIMMLTFELGSEYNKDFEIKANNTIAEILNMVNNG